MPVFTPDTVKIDTQTAADSPCGPATLLRFSDSGGLTQFGAFVEILPPGSRSSLCHWHAEEDEMVYMLDGEVSLYENGVATPLRAGQAATFKAGVAVGHYLKNEGTAEARYLVIGTRARRDTVTYPDHDRKFTRDDDRGEVIYMTLDGQTGVGSAYDLPDA